MSQDSRIAGMKSGVRVGLCVVRMIWIKFCLAKMQLLEYMWVGLKEFGFLQMGQGGVGCGNLKDLVINSW